MMNALEQNLEIQDKRLQVLIVEDDHASASSLAELMALQGFDAQIAVNGREAIWMAHEFLPDVILLDIGLPVMDGYHVVQELRQEADASTALIVAVTGHGLPEDQEHSYSSGIDLHLTKPLDVNFLKEILANYSQELLA